MGRSTPMHFVNAAGYKLWVETPTHCGYQSHREGLDFTTLGGFAVEWWSCPGCGKKWTTEVRL